MSEKHTCSHEALYAVVIKSAKADGSHGRFNRDLLELIRRQ
jgi:hypothetical protein